MKGKNPQHASLPHRVGREVIALPVRWGQCARVSLDVWAHNMIGVGELAEIVVLGTLAWHGVDPDVVGNPIVTCDPMMTTFVDQNRSSPTFGKTVGGWRYMVLFDIRPRSAWEHLRLKFFFEVRRSLAAIF